MRREKRVGGGGDSGRIRILLGRGHGRGSRAASAGMVIDVMVEMTLGAMSRELENREGSNLMGG